MLQATVTSRNLFFSILLCSASFSVGATNVIMQTTLGDIEIELFDDDTPGTVANFLNYVNDGDYEDSFIHRSVPGFVIQGGGFAFKNGEVVGVPTDPPIANEFNHLNLRGTISMAKLGGDKDSATSQWFINLSDNPNLDSGDGQGGGFFTVFGQVVGNGMEIVDAIEALEIVNARGVFSALPVRNFSGSPPVLQENLIFANVRLAEPAPVEFEINPGISGAWIDASTSGQGWLFDVIANDPTTLQLFVAWFTYDVNDPIPDDPDEFGSRQHRWFTAFGKITGDTANLEISLNRGGIFNDPLTTSIERAGSMTIQLSDCTHGTLSFDFDASDDHDATVDITRLATDIFCQDIIDAAQASVMSSL